MTVKTAQVLDLETMQFEAGPTMKDARCVCVTTALDAERALVIGGQVNGATSATTEVLGVADELETRRRRR